MNERFSFDEKYIKTADFLIGTDEAGRGPGAGPVFAASVCFKSMDNKTKKLLDDLNDSKQLTEKQREELYEIIINNSIWTLQQGSVEEIEKLNILRCSLLAMKKCVEEIGEKLNSNNIIVLVDGNKRIPELKYKQEAIVKGDYKSATIAAASIIAKVSRDRYMIQLDKEFPMYNWRENKGYLTKEHLDAVDKYGLTIWHRKKFFEKHFEKSTQLSFFR